MRGFVRWAFLPGFLFILACAPSQSNSDLESAETALNAGDCSSARDLSSAVLAANPQDLEAARLLSSAYFCLSALDSTDLTAKLIELDDSADASFSEVATVVPATTVLENLVAASDTLADCACTLDKDALFQQALYQSYASFIVGISASLYNTGEENFDATLIADDDVADVLKAFQQFDNAYIASGVADDDDVILSTRENYCLVTTNSSDGSFDAGLYRALVCCQLFEDACATLNALTDQVASCDALDPDNQGDAFATCKASDTI